MSITSRRTSGHYEPNDSVRWELRGTQEQSVSVEQLKKSLTILLEIINSGDLASVKTDTEFHALLDSKYRAAREDVKIFGLEKSTPGDPYSALLLS